MTFFGPDLRNGLPIGLGSVAGFGIAPQFSPASLFLGGTVQGAWYDPSDSTTLFSNRAGTTPCGTPGGGSVVPVGLMLDKSQGLVLGSETVTNGGPGFTATTGWTAEGTNTVAVVGGELEVTLNSALFNGIAGTNLTTVAGQWYRIVVTARRGTTASNFILRVDSASNDITFTSTNSTTVNYYFRASGTSAGIRFLTAASGGTGTFYVTSVSVRAIAGNHAIAANDTTARPELRARVNLLTYSEQFDNAYWIKRGINAFGSGSVANTTATLDPLGGNTADFIQESTAASVHGVDNNGITLPASTFIHSVYVKAATRSWAYVRLADAAGKGAYFNLSNGTIGTVEAGITAAISSVGNGWYRCSVSIATTAGLWYPFTGAASGDNQGSYTGDGTSGIYIWGAQLTATNEFPANTYQRISDANTYDAVGFPRYLACNGTSSAMSTPGNVNLSGTDKVTVFAGVRRNITSTSFPVEFSASSDANNGAFAIGTDSSGFEYFLKSRGTTLRQVDIDSAAYNAPVSNVVTLSADIAAPSVVARINAAQVGSNTNSQGTGNYGTYPLFIGSRNNSIYFLNGNIYSLIVVGSAVSAGQISATEQWVAGKTGITI